MLCHWISAFRISRARALALVFFGVGHDDVMDFLVCLTHSTGSIRAILEKWLFRMTFVTQRINLAQRGTQRVSISRKTSFSLWKSLYQQLSSFLTSRSIPVLWLPTLEGQWIFVEVIPINSKSARNASKTLFSLQEDWHFLPIGLQ